MRSVGTDVDLQIQSIIKQLLWIFDIHHFIWNPFLSSRITPSVESWQGEYGSVCFSWHLDSFIFYLNQPTLCSLYLYMMHTGGTLSRWNISNRDSCASILSFIGNNLVQPKPRSKTSEYLLPHQDTYPQPKCQQTPSAVTIYTSWHGTFPWTGVMVKCEEWFK